jgi:hypothetical protein
MTTTVGLKLNLLAKGRPHMLINLLPRTTERPVRNCGDECSVRPARAVPQSHGRNPVVRGLLQIGFQLFDGLKCHGVIRIELQRTAKFF